MVDSQGKHQEATITLARRSGSIAWRGCVGCTLVLVAMLLPHVTLAGNRRGASSSGRGQRVSAPSTNLTLAAETRDTTGSPNPAAPRTILVACSALDATLPQGVPELSRVADLGGLIGAPLPAPQGERAAPAHVSPLPLAPASRQAFLQVLRI